jgi:iron complex outermembrane receptor protein
MGEGVVQSVLFGSNYKSITRAALAAVSYLTLAGAIDANAQAVALPTIDVTGQSAERGDGPVVGYVAKQSMTATKTDTPVLETPQSISIVTKDQIAAQRAQTLNEALRYTPGVSLDTAGATTFYDAIVVRGFQPPQYLDGLQLPLDPGTQFAVPRIEPYGLERIEVLKGPSGALYGQANPGGIVNMVGKKPLPFSHAEILGQLGSFDRYQGAFDFGGATKDARFAYRLVGLFRDANTQIDFVEDNKQFIAPSFTWQPTLDTSLTILAHYQNIDNKGFGQTYVPAGVSMFPNPFGRVPYSRYIGEPGRDGFKLEQGAIGYEFEHRFTNTLQFRSNFRYMTVNNDLTGIRSEGLLPDFRSVLRTVNYVLAESESLTTDNHLQGDFIIGPTAHKVLFGVDYRVVNSNSDYRSAGIAPIDAFNPIYGAAMPARGTLPPVILNDAKQEQLGVYLQDQIKFDRWSLTLSGRHDLATTTNDNRAFFPPPGFVSQEDSALTGRVGLNYLFDFGLAPYVSYSTSFIPVAGTTLAGSPFKPLEGRGAEVGVKYQPIGMNLLLTAAAFEIYQENILSADPANPFFSLQTDEARVRGVEFEARGNVTRELEIVGGYSYLDPRVSKSALGPPGNYLPNVALQQASLWAYYTFYTGSIAGFGFGGGVRYVGESYGDAANTLQIPSYTLFDAALSYDFAYLRPELKGLKAQINARNLTDEYYVANCFTGIAYCGLGASRSILFTLRYNWQQQAQLAAPAGLITK